MCGSRPIRLPVLITRHHHQSIKDELETSVSKYYRINLKINKYTGLCPVRDTAPERLRPAIHVTIVCVTAERVGAVLAVGAATGARIGVRAADTHKRAWAGDGDRHEVFLGPGARLVAAAYVRICTVVRRIRGTAALVTPTGALLRERAVFLRHRHADPLHRRQCHVLPFGSSIAP